MVSLACRQLMGTAAGNHLYAQGGWTRSGSASVGFVGASLVICLARGPWETDWVGWGGGWGLKRRAKIDYADEGQRGDTHIPETDRTRADMSLRVEGDIVGDNAGIKTALESLQH